MLIIIKNVQDSFAEIAAQPLRALAHHHGVRVDHGQGYLEDVDHRAHLLLRALHL